jgi:hypothetical protein
MLYMSVDCYIGNILIYLIIHIYNVQYITDTRPFSTRLHPCALHTLTKNYPPLYGLLVIVISYVSHGVTTGRTSIDTLL